MVVRYGPIVHPPLLCGERIPILWGMFRLFFLLIFAQAVLAASAQCPDSSAALTTTTVFGSEDVVHAQIYNYSGTVASISYSTNSNVHNPNLGESCSFSVNGGLQPDAIAKYYAKFPPITPASGKGLHSAKLRVYLYGGTVYGGGAEWASIAVGAVAVPWSESNFSLSWNAPISWSDQMDAALPNGAPTWLEFDVTSVIANIVGTGDWNGFRFEGDAGGNSQYLPCGRATMSGLSNPNGNSPRLILEWEPIAEAVATQVGCDTVPIGTATVSASSAIPPLTYAWDTNANSQTTATATGLAYGNYSVTVQDSSGCTLPATVLVDSGNTITIPFSTTSPVGCDTVPIGTATVSGSTAIPASPITYSWDANANSQTTATATGLTYGTYSVTVHDATGCSLPTTVLVDSGNTTTIAVSVTGPSTPSASNGAASVVAANGFAPYTYAWSNGTGTIDSTASVSGLGNNAYTFSVFDATGCVTTASFNPVDSGCFAVDTVWAYNVQHTSATLKWFPNPNAVAYRIQYKVAGTSNWTTAWKHNNVGHKQLTGLSPSTTYKYRIRSICSSQNNNASIWTSMGTFYTLAGPCYAPSGISAAPLGSVQARINWNPFPSAVSQRLRYRVQGSTSGWTVIPKSGTASHQWLTGLSASTTYEVQLRSLCQYGNVTGTPWTLSYIFDTAPSAKSGPAPELIATGKPTSELEVQLVPNPAHGSTQLWWEQVPSNAAAATIAVYDVTGRVVQQQITTVHTGDQTPIGVGQPLVPGYYLVAVRVGNLRATKRLIVH